MSTLSELVSNTRLSLYPSQWMMTMEVLHFASAIAAAMKNGNAVCGSSRTSISPNCTDDEYGGSALRRSYDNCRGTAMGSCVDGVASAAFIDDVNSVDFNNAEGEDEGPATGSASGRFPRPTLGRYTRVQFHAYLRVNSVEFGETTIAMQSNVSWRLRSERRFQHRSVTLSHEVCLQFNPIGNRLRHFVASTPGACAMCLLCLT